MTEVTIISVFLFALVIGFMIGRRFPSNKQAAKFEQQVTEQQQQLNDYQSKLTNCQNELKQQASEQSKYQQQVSTHFAKTADLMDSIAQQYQTLYQHMSTNAAQLLPAEEASRNISIFKRNKHESQTAQPSQETLASPSQEEQVEPTIEQAAQAASEVDSSSPKQLENETQKEQEVTHEPLEASAETEDKRK